MVILSPPYHTCMQSSVRRDKIRRGNMGIDGVRGVMGYSGEKELIKHATHESRKMLISWSDDLTQDSQKYSPYYKVCLF